MPYSYRKDIIDHKQKVSANMFTIIQELYHRQALHDNDKITNDLIFEPYDMYNNELRRAGFGSERYKHILKNELGEAADLHAQNRHHFYAKAHACQTDVNIFDVIEALIDIKSAIERYDDHSPEEVQLLLKNSMQRILSEQTLDTVIENTIDYFYEKNGEKNND